ncbi:flagellar motor switch protein FliG [Amnibacterium endophyticum]|uniref:Flagellar motor switch protein FliG n=1 Tax=Amnibacterium endophyticum TaxID=2109337 RepID=A0ABW4LG47_9MICO
MTAEVETRELTGVQKAALVLMNMSTERASAVLRTFGAEEAEEITAEMARMRDVSGRDAMLAIEQFKDLVEAPPEPTELTGHDVATQLIEAAFEGERQTELLERIAAPGSSATFAFLEELEPARAAALVEHDSAEVVAFVLVQLGPDLAAKILMSQDPGRRVDIARAVATMTSPAPEAGSIVADVLRRRARLAASETVIAIDDDGEPGVPQLRVQPLVDIMNHAEPADEGALLDGLREKDGLLADEVRARLLSFEDVPRLQDRDLQQVLRGVDLSTLALALKGAASEISSAITSNMSERNRESLAEEAGELGRVPKRQVEEARNVVVRAIRELAGTTGLELKKVAGEEAPAEETDVPETGPAEPEEEYVD